MELSADTKAAFAASPHKQCLFLDEAGTDAESPVAVVAGVMYDPDLQFSPVLAIAAEMWKSIPDRYRENFICHGKSLFTNELWPDWPYEQRKQFFVQLMSLPRLFGYAVCAGFVRLTDQTIGATPPVKDESLRHLTAFAFCIITADQLIRQYGREDDVGFTFAEHIPPMHDSLTKVFLKLKTDPWSFEGMREESIVGEVPSQDFSIKKMHGGPTFLPKGPLLLQIADACAFGFKRALSGRPDGPEYYGAIFGQQYVPEHYSSAIGRIGMLPRPPRRLTILSDPNGMIKKEFGLDVAPASYLKFGL